MSYPFPFFFLPAFGVSASSWTHISLLCTVILYQFLLNPCLPQIISTNSSLLQVLDDCLPCFLCRNITFKHNSQLSQYPNLPVRECSFPLTGSRLVLGLDHHHASLSCSKLESDIYLLWGI